ncbi:MAG TPA: DUF4142 domain-containing protein [Methylomirabilota bacterium]|jgi:putative membrane protein|nr:DUF4142 domain-containing protein [Methylomirabilota bacterium]
MRNAAVALALAAVVFVVPAVGAAQQQSKTDHKVARGDQSFMKDAAQDNIGEIELGRLASQRGASDAVKQFGQRMATDHGTALDELKQLAQSKGVTLPTDTDRAHKRLHDRLSKLSGAEFDREYMKAMVGDHDKDAKKFAKEAGSAKDPDLKAWASKTLPVLKEHQQQAHQVMASVRGGSPAALPRQK